MEEEKKTKKNREDRVGLGQLLIWNSRQISVSIFVLLSGFLMIYCTDTLKIPAAVVSMILVASKVLDGITDMFAGFIVDRTETKWGKGRPYEVFIVGLWICTWLMFSCPVGWSTTIKCVWIFIMYALVNSVCMTFLNANATPYVVRAYKDKQIVKLTSYGSIITMLAAVIFNIILDDGALPVLMPGVKMQDPEYFEDYWKVPGYLGADPNGNAVRDRICLDGKITQVNVPGLKAQILEGKIDTRNGVNDAWRKMIASEEMDDEPWVELETEFLGEDPYVKGSVMIFLTGAAKGRQLQLGRIEGKRVYLTEGYGMDNIVETLKLLSQGDEIHMDNSDYVAVQTYHRHQVPSLDYHAWDQFRDENGDPLYPQQNVLLGPGFCGQGPGCKQNGLIQAKVLIVAALMDEQAYPWQADWYRRKIASVHDGNETDYCRLWYFDNVLHDDRVASVDELRVTTYAPGLKQALVDLAAWVEKGIEPLPSSKYRVNVGSVEVPDPADDRGGIQPVVHALANGSKCAHVKAGENVQFTANAEVPKGAGTLTDVEWSFEGGTDYPYKGEFALTDGGKCGNVKAEHVFEKPGTYFVSVRVKSQRNGDKNDLFTQVKNIDRVRVVVE